MKKNAILLACAAALSAAAYAQAPVVPGETVAEPDIVAQDGTALINHPGRVTFERQCAPCHGTGPGDDRSDMLPGTAALAAKYEGSQPAALELRTNLPPEVLAYFVRNGVGAMPAFRPAEITDAQIEEIADYIALNAQAHAAQER